MSPKRIAGAWLLFMAASAVVVPFFMREASQMMETSRLLEAPSFMHLFGTDALGRDVVSRVLCGARVSLGVALISVTIALLIGILIGAVAGYYGGRIERVLMGVVDVFLCFPTFFLMLAVIAVLGPSVLNIIAVISITSWMGTARLVRAEVLSLKEREFILAARGLGLSDAQILARHLIPNAIAPAIVNAVLGLSTAILAETALSFLGIGVQPPTPSWGNMLMEGKATLGVAWWLMVFPGTMIFFTVMSANILGEELHGRSDT